MQVKSLRFEPGDTAFVHPCTADRKVKVIALVQGHKFPHWKVQDEGGAYWIVSQLRLSARPTVISRGVAKLLALPAEVAA